MRVQHIRSVIQREKLPESGPSDLVKFRTAPYLDREHPTRSVLSTEMAIRRKKHEEAGRFSRARIAAELDQALQKERSYVVDDGLEENAPTDETEKPELQETLDHAQHEESSAPKN